MVGAEAEEKHSNIACRSIRQRFVGGLLKGVSSGNSAHSAIHIGVPLEAESHECGISYFDAEDEKGQTANVKSSDRQQEQEALDTGANEKPRRDMKLIADEVVYEVETTVFSYR